MTYTIVLFSLKCSMAGTLYQKKEAPLRKKVNVFYCSNLCQIGFRYRVYKYSRHIFIVLVITMIFCAITSFHCLRYDKN